MGASRRYRRCCLSGGPWRLASSRHPFEVAHSDEIEDRGGEGEHPVDPFRPSVSRITHQTDSLGPSEGLLDPLTFPQCLRATRPLSSKRESPWIRIKSGFAHQPGEAITVTKSSEIHRAEKYYTIPRSRKAAISSLPIPKSSSRTDSVCSPRPGAPRSTRPGVRSKRNGEFTKG